jgi:protein involved in polysaccharide export with SLBB domain
MTATVLWCVALMGIGIVVPVAMVRGAETVATTPKAADKGNEIYISGAVRQPGVYSLGEKPFTVKQALTAAEFDTENAKGAQCLLVRRSEGNKEERVVISVAGLLNGTEADRPLKPYDMLVIGTPANGGDTAAIKPGDGNVPSGAAAGLTIVAADEVPKQGEPGEYYVMGEVPRQGVYSLTGRNITLKQAIAATGADLNELRTMKAALIRRTPGDKVKKVEIDLGAVIDGTEADRFLQANDMVNIHKPNAVPAKPAAAAPAAAPTTTLAIVPADVEPAQNGEPGEFYIMGEVRRQGVYALAGKKLTLMQAVAAAAGFDNAQIHTMQADLLRKTGDKKTTVQVDLGAVWDGLEPDRFIQPGDIINVRKKADPAPPNNAKPAREHEQLLLQDNQNTFDERNRALNQRAMVLHNEIANTEAQIEELQKTQTNDATKTDEQAAKLSELQRQLTIRQAWLQETKLQQQHLLTEEAQWLLQHPQAEKPQSATLP